jgi:hypothetical protein
MRRFCFAFIFGTISLLVACGGGGSSSTGPSAPTLSSIQVSGQNNTLVAGQTQQMTAIGKYSDGSTKDLTSSAQWSTSDGAIATIGSGGVLTAKTSGQCSVVAGSGAVKGSTTVDITPALVSIAVTPANPTTAVGTAQQFIATGTYSDNSTQNLTTSVSWSSSDTAVATISSTAPTMGFARAVSGGTATISASQGLVSGSTSLTVSTASAVSIAVTPLNPTKPLGVSQQFTATGTFSDGSTQDITNVVKWSSSSTNVANITASGFATSGNVGTTTISASFTGVSGASLLTVNAANLTGITIQPGNGSIAQGTKQQFTATGTFNDGSTRDITHTVVWTSSDPTILSIGSSSGIGKGLVPGLVNVTATLGSSSSTVPFNVSNALVTSVSLTPTSITLPIGAQKQFSATATFNDGSSQDVSSVVAWSSNNTSVATVGTTSANLGLVSSAGSGTAHVNASFSYAGATATGSAPVTVTTATLTSIAITPSSALLAPASGTQLTATGTFSDGTVLRINPSVQWSTSDNTIATVNTTGFVTGQSGGIVGITAQQGAVSATANILVESAALTSIQISPASSQVPVTILRQFKATGTFANGDTQDLTGFVSWTSSVPSIATISNAQSTAGSATGLQPGTTHISAVFAGQTGNATLTVSSATLVSIAATPSNASISVGGSQQFTATGTFSDGSALDLTNQVTWSSSNSGIAGVSRGLTTGVASGTVSVSASLNGVTGAATLNVQ